MFEAHKATVGVPCSLSFPILLGMMPSVAGTRRISVDSSTQDSSTPSSEMIRPIAMNFAPHGPTTAANTPASDGSASPETSVCDMIP